MEIRKARRDEYKKVREFYDRIIELMEFETYSPGWKKGIYPEDDALKKAIDKQEMFVDILNNEIIAAMVINHECNESYQKIQWKNNYQTDEVMVIHILGVLPTHGNQGLGKDLVRQAIHYAKSHQQKAVRLDVLEGNIPAEKLYTSMGFQYYETISMYYEDTGWTNYEIYEYEL